MYIDIASFTEKITAIRTGITANLTYQNSINTKGAALSSALDAAVISSWSRSDGNGKKKLGVFFIPLLGSSTTAASHGYGYIQNSIDMNKSAFIEAAGNYWAPNTTPQSDNFLDKLFYWTY
jgi:hypothetical protein